MALKEGCLPKEAVSTVEGKSDGEILSTAFFKESKALSQYLDLPTLLPILRSKSLVTCEEFIHLATRWEKGLRESTNSLLLQLLPRKGPRWSLLLYEALQEEVEHRGHEHLVKLLQRTTAELQVSRDDDQREEDQRGEKCCCCLKCQREIRRLTHENMMLPKEADPHSRI